MSSKSAAAQEHSQRVTMLYIRAIQEAWKLHLDDPWTNEFVKFVDDLIEKCPENKHEIVAAERFVRTGE